MSTRNAKTDPTETARIERLRNANLFYVAITGQTDDYVSLQASLRMWAELDAS